MNLSNIFNPYFIRFFFCRMKYYKQMATHLNLKLPKMNQQIQLPQNSLCVVYGIRQVLPEESILNKQKTQKQKILTYYDQQKIMQFAIDKDSKKVLEFDLVKKIAKGLELDVCLMQQQISFKQVQSQQKVQQLQKPQVVISLTKFKQNIYRQYYLKQLKNTTFQKYVNNVNKQSETQQDEEQDQDEDDVLNKLKKHKGRVKTIRLGESIQERDLLTKINQIERWRAQGERLFKIMTLTDTAKAQKTIKTFCLKFQQQVDVLEQQYQPNLRKKPVIRLYGILQFHQQIQINPEFINKRWRRKHLYQEKQKNRAPFQEPNYAANQNFKVQRQYIEAFSEAGIPYPKQFDYLNKMKESMDKGQDNFISDVLKESEEQIENDSKQKQNSDLEQQLMSLNQQRKMQIRTRRLMQTHTVQDIIQEMEQLKSRSYQMQSYQSSKYKELQNELKNKLKQVRKRRRNNQKD